MNLSIFFSFLNTIASRAYDAIANRSRAFAALTPAQRATAIAKLTPAQRATAIANLTARAESNLDIAEQGWRNPCWLTNADTYLTLATEYGYIEGVTRRRLDRLRRDFDSLESVNDYTEGDDYNAATIHYAGLSCGCGDYSCPRMHNDTAQCVNAE